MHSVLEYFFGFSRFHPLEFLSLSSFVHSANIRTAQHLALPKFQNGQYVHIPAQWVKFSGSFLHVALPHLQVAKLRDWQGTHSLHRCTLIEIRVKVPHPAIAAVAMIQSMINWVICFRCSGTYQSIYALYSFGILTLRILCRVSNYELMRQAKSRLICLDMTITYQNRGSEY